jgi:nucleoside-specific outer membrane channel protein Tsx
VTTHLRSHLSAVTLALAVCLAPAAARAEFATTNLQGLAGWDFHDPVAGGNDAVGGYMSTLTLNHFSTWAGGDNFAFVDLMQGDFRDGTKSHLYAEWHPRLLLTKLLGAQGKTLGVFRDAGLAFELNLGQGFQVYLAGLGGDVPVGAGLVSVNVYYRYDELQVPGFGNSYNHTWQVSPSWAFPFKVGPVPLLFTGFVDVNGVKSGDGWQGIEVMAQPELLFDVLAVAGGPAGKLFAGVEWYLHHHPSNANLGAPDDLVSVPQAMVQWNLH